MAGWNRGELYFKPKSKMACSEEEKKKKKKKKKKKNDEEKILKKRNYVHQVVQ